MSHFTTVKTKINSLASLQKTLDRMNLPYRVAEEGQGVEIRGYRGQTMKAEVAIDMGKYDIGVVKAEDGNYTLVADWWGIEVTRGKTEKELIEEVNREYAYVRIVEACEAQGYQIAKDDIQVGEDGTVQLVATKWG